MCYSPLPLHFARSYDVVPYLTSRPLQPCVPFPTAFNNTSIQFVRSDALAERPSDWWALPGAAPETDEVEEARPAPDAGAPQEAPSSESQSKSEVSEPESARTPDDAHPNAAAAAVAGDECGDGTTTPAEPSPSQAGRSRSADPKTRAGPGAGSGLENGGRTSAA